MLKFPVSSTQIEAATKLYKHLPNWRLSDAALEQLADHLRGKWDESSTLLKCTSINVLYSTRIYDVVSMAKHVSKIMSADSTPRGLDLVESIADARLFKVEKKYRSFASKLCNFFVSSDQYPILDESAVRALKYHFGRGKVVLEKTKRPYSVYSEAIQELCSLPEIGGYSRQVDRYLWVVGSYIRSRGKTNPPISPELKEIFCKPTGEQIKILEVLLPKSLL